MKIIYNINNGLHFADGEIEDFVDNLELNSDKTIVISNYLAILYIQHKALSLGIDVEILEDNKDIGINIENGNQKGLPKKYVFDIFEKILMTGLNLRKKKRNDNLL